MASLRWFNVITAFVFILIMPMRVEAQETRHVFRALVQDAHEGYAISGVNVSLEGSSIGAATDSEGKVSISGIPSGEQTFQFSFIGFEQVRLTLTFPLADRDEVFLVLLEEAHDELEEIAVTATRTSRTIADQATRIETIAGEEIEEKISMEPSNISMLLNESPGITVQQTSAVSGGASIRIQGLDGRYTQILKDGFPLYGGFSGGLSLLQVPPLDLRQVEIIKGPSSTFYGGDAIAGLVNLVSKGPSAEPELSLLSNLTTAGGMDLGGFYRARNERIGTTVLVSANTQKAYDPDDDAFSNLPETRRLTLNPKVFFYPSSKTIYSFGVSATIEEREGGDIQVLNNGVSANRTFFETNTSKRLSSQARMDHQLTQDLGITIKNSVSLFDRSIEVPDYRFEGQQIASYSEASALMTRGPHQISIGLDLRSDAFREDVGSAGSKRDYTYTSAGLFAQDTWDYSERAVVEAGVRVDRHNTFGSFVLPKASILYRVSDKLSARIGAGLGYKAPTVFLEPSEERAFRNVIPLSSTAQAETSRGGSIDVNYRTLLFDRLAVSFNQAFYFTDLQRPLIPVFETIAGQPDGSLSYENADGEIQTRAFETNAKFALSDFKLFLGYVNLSARTGFETGSVSLPLTPQHKTYTVLVYEKHGKGRIGLEAYYTGQQRLMDGSDSDGFWILGVMAERRLGKSSLFLNFENFLDTMQSNYAPVVLGTRQNPRFDDIWAPMDGFIINGGIKYTL
ncbi:MAG: TonB-dependent receptor [Bacteroidetes Order II. Incertae sedis bacterium]|jgi:outer membrane receptor for ferrienterochelin and colicins|nr:TonB-dependent receptor [Bacteroidetes Order II. bacterium]MBT5248746.1 TonB-dependent receptor [Bacteroidetes Order II. bacterium]MBT6201057.1 TonB-dependent receptor [Bacteroidetes Order II. bacterium]MBT6425655.1 TonB-dependent receptor [Bacteroidetes Order II. bacterium]MBT6580968.1 TonB-dependent receptor [Bacteroidetes Order II. bacterium]